MSSRNWLAVEIVSALCRELGGYWRGALIPGAYPADARERERRQSMLADLRAKLFEAQQKKARE